MRSTAYALACLVVMTAPSSAQSFIGPGGISCSEVIQLPKNSSTRWMVGGYAQGYISGMAAAIYVQSKQDILAPVLANEVLEYVDFFCGENPNKTLLNASNAYLTYLGRKGRR